MVPFRPVRLFIYLDRILGTVRITIPLVVPRLN